MKFFVPQSEGLKMTPEEIFKIIVKFAEQTMGWKVSDKRIYSISYNHKGRNYIATVGEKEVREGEPVIAILESNTYLICTPNRGVLRGMPIMVGKEELLKIDYFNK